MKIITKTGNLLDITKGHIVHGCNACGVMGSGVAVAIKRRYSTAYQDYRTIYEEFGLDLGVPYPHCPTTDLCIWNAITQQGFGESTRNCSYDAIQTCFEQIDNAIAGFDEIVREIHIPKIGAGLGGGNWEIIREIIEQTVTHPVTLWVLPT